MLKQTSAWSAYRTLDNTAVAQKWKTLEKMQGCFKLSVKSYPMLGYFNSKCWAVLLKDASILNFSTDTEISDDSED